MFIGYNEKYDDWNVTKKNATVYYLYILDVHDGFILDKFLLIAMGVVIRFRALLNWHLNIWHLKVTLPSLVIKVPHKMMSYL